MVNAKILLVDDEPAVLSGYARTLHNEFDVDTAVGGELALAAIEERGPFAVVVSDMRMPGMNGAQLLQKVRQASPDTVRMLLTGYTDLSAAIEAVNEGNIFRFLTKPCPKETLVAAIGSGVQQYDLIRSEKELLEKTLVGSIRMLADFLGAASPEAFGGSARVAAIVRFVARKFTFEALWRLEAAATLCALGCVTLDSDLTRAAFEGVKLTPEEQAGFAMHPEAAMRLLSGIPRLEPTAWIIGHQLAPEIPTEIPDLPPAVVHETVLGAKILKLAVAFDELLTKRFAPDQAILRLRAHEHEYDRELTAALEGYRAESKRMVSCTLPYTRLTTGMILDQELRNKQDMLLMAKGQEITEALLLKVQNFSRAGLIDKDLKVLAPV